MQRTGTQSGFAELHVGSVHGRSTVLRSRAASPLCLLTPRARGSSVWAYTSSLGGGMVAGDEVQIDVSVDGGARCFLGTQASNKVYRNPQGLPCSHQLTAKVGPGALLASAPDPVQCFAEASYEQWQSFELAAAANLIVVDWVSSGRPARGERWAFRRYFSRNEVTREGRTIFLDALELDSDLGPLGNQFRTGRFNCLATIVILGPALREFAGELLGKIAGLPIQPGASFVSSASELKEGAVVRMAGAAVEEVGAAICRHLRFLRGLLDDDPWARKW